VNKVLHTPISDADLANIKIGDVIYLDGIIVTCRDVAHRRLIELRRELPVDLRGLAIFHAGPIVKKNSDGTYQMVSVGPTTSMRMEKFEKEFVRQTGVKLLVGKGGMAADTEEACRTYKALHCVFPGGCAVLAAAEVEQIERVEWLDLGMPESLWVNRVKGFGPLIVSIDAQGNNLFKQNKVIFNERKEKLVAEISEKVRFIK
jgi:L(+)-tartrate dehydratase beta subunit